MERPRILVADDDPTMRAALRTKLSKLGYQVAEASDGLEVLSHCHVGWVGTIILDHEMPNANGRSVAHSIRSRCNAPIVFLSGHGKEEFRSIVMELPDVYYLSKPLDDDKLAALLASLTDHEVLRPPPRVKSTISTSSAALHHHRPLGPRIRPSAALHESAGWYSS
jgi:DNA-binding response OmpR family regulator